MTTDERWRVVEDFPAYEVSDLGRVRRGDRQKALIVSPQGYVRVTLFKGNGQPGAQRFVHALVLEAFVGPRPAGMQSRHFPSNDKTDNRLSNLSWCTKAQNEEDKRTHGTLVVGDRHWHRKLAPEKRRRGDRSATTKLSDAGVASMRMLFSFGATAIACAEWFGISHSQALNIKRFRQRAICG